MARADKAVKRRLLIIVNVDWFFLSHRLPIALAARDAGFEVHLATKFTTHKAQLEAEGFNLHSLDIQRSNGSPVALLREFLSIFRVMRTVKADVAHLVTVKPVLLGGLAARVTRTGGVLAAISGLGTIFVARGWRGRLRRALVKQLYRLALGHQNVRVLVQNDDDRTLVLTMTRLHDDLVTLIPGSGVDTELFCPQPTVSGGKLVVMFAGRLLRDKGIKEFFDAAKWLRDDPDIGSDRVRFVLVGAPDPDNVTSLTTETVEGWQREGVIELWGSRTDMVETLNAADIVVLPSYREGLPKTLLEAAACGKAIVTSDVPGCRDAIIPGITGVLVNVRDSRSLAGGIKQLLVDQCLRRKMGEQGRKLAVERFTIQVVTQTHLALYDGLVANDKSREMN
jgi:glycosyltransferase involved in cell wall biosynthesis